MAALVAPFGQHQQLPLSPVMSSGSIDVNLLDQLAFTVVYEPNNTAMETGGNPTIMNFTFYVDGVERDIDTLEWVSGTELLVEAYGAAATVSMELRQNLVDVNVRNTDGVKAVPPDSAKDFV